MVAELRAPVADKLEITLSLLIKRADQIFKQAMAAGQFNAAIAALKELGVLSGKRVERSERGEPGEFDRMSDEELREAVTESARALGFVPVRKTSIEYSVFALRQVDSVLRNGRPTAREVPMKPMFFGFTVFSRLL
jgi:hypothetical protein